MGVTPTSRTTLRDADQEAHLDRYGFAVVPFLNPAEFAKVQAAYAEIGTAPDDPRLSITWSFHSRSADHKHMIKQVVGRLIEGATRRLLADRLVGVDRVQASAGRRGQVGRHPQRR